MFQSRVAARGDSFCSVPPRRIPSASVRWVPRVRSTPPPWWLARRPSAPVGALPLRSCGLAGSPAWGLRRPCAPHHRRGGCTRRPSAPVGALPLRLCPRADSPAWRPRHPDDLTAAPPCRTPSTPRFVVPVPELLAALVPSWPCSTNCAFGDESVKFVKCIVHQEVVMYSAACNFVQGCTHLKMHSYVGS